ncbi:hypothetical protein [Paenibacillus antibioticophila]|uniref:hypothetical protein n=1 Tax=Paenibacillus antibioticophila TaxID=1274374 RepID=UPI0005C8CDCF|nr:hypothetical protein [Paenibacillus antibioticophila]
MIKEKLIAENTLKRIGILKDQSFKIFELFRCLSEAGDIIIVGGALRNFAFENVPRDIDIIIDDCSRDELDDKLKEFDYQKNRFGGYKIKVDNIEFDIWSIYDNWAFKEGIHSSTFSNISKSTFFNFDAIAFNISTSELDADTFVHAFDTNLLDITLEDDFVPLNPTPEVNVMRAFHIHNEWGLEFSDKVKDYVSEWFLNTSDPYDKLHEAELKHYGKVFDKERYKFNWY